jgi:hypothetical protein
VPALSIHGTRRPAELKAMPEDVRGFLTAVMNSIDADLQALTGRNPSARVARPAAALPDGDPLQQLRGRA